MNGDQQEFEIHAQEATTVKVLDPFHVMIDQEDENAHGGLVSISIRGPHNLDQLLSILTKIRREMP